MPDSDPEDFEALAARWDLRALRQELAVALDRAEADRRPYVPSQLARALDMFLDSYAH